LLTPTIDHLFDCGFIVFGGEGAGLAGTSNASEAAAFALTAVIIPLGQWFTIPIYYFTE
jgi:hypothetical protein